MNQLIPKTEKPKRREVVRLATGVYRDKRGLHIRRSLTVLKRKSIEPGMLDEEISMTSPDEVAAMIVNLNECKDGIYILVMCNEWRDWETGHIDSYDFKMIALGE